MAESDTAKAAIKIIKGLDRLIQDAKKLKDEVKAIADQKKTD